MKYTRSKSVTIGSTRKPGYRSRTRAARWSAAVLLSLICVSVPIVASAAGNNWQTAASLTTARFALGSGTAPCQGDPLHNCLYAIGGDNGSVLGSVEMYNPGNDSLTGPAATCLYAIGGYKGLNTLTSVEMFDPGTNAWTPVASLSTGIYYSSATSGPCEADVKDTCVYLIGGTDGIHDALNSVEMYKPVADTWTPVATLHTARRMAGAANGPCTGNLTATCVYAIGGADVSGNYLSSVEMYTPSSNTWKTVGSLETSRWFFGATSGPCQGSTSALCLYAMGGYNNSGNFQVGRDVLSQW